MTSCTVGDTSQHVIDACIMVNTYHAQSLDLSCPPAHDPENPDLDILPTMYESQAHEINKWVPDYLALMPMFGWLPADMIKQTFASDHSVCLPSHEHPPQIVV